MKETRELSTRQKRYAELISKTIIGFIILGFLFTISYLVFFFILMASGVEKHLLPGTALFMSSFLNLLPTLMIFGYILDK